MTGEAFIERYLALAVLLRGTGFAIRHDTVGVVERRHAAWFEAFVAGAGAGIGNGETLERRAEVYKTPCRDQRMKVAARIGLGIDTRRKSR